DENHRCTPQIVAVATSVLGAKTGQADMELPITTRVDGPVPQVIAHDSDDDEAVWAAKRAKASRTPGRRWSSIAVLTRTNAQLQAVQVALEAARVPCLVAGADLGPGSDLGSTSGRRGSEADEDGNDEVTVERDCVVLSTFHRSKGLQWSTVLVLGLSAGLMPLAAAQTQEAIDEEKRLLYVALTRAEEELFCSWSRGDGSGRGTERSPSPWLTPIERTVTKLAAEAAPTAAADVSARVAELRARLEEAGGSTR
ncbi:MAG: 3'-5' exonuclease, partial [Streptosporangiaceae bacterium]